MTYQPSIYKEPGGNTLVVATSGKISMESGSTMTIASGAGVTLAATLTAASGGVVALASGAALTVAAGSYATMPYQSLSSTQTATAVNTYGVTLLTGTTTGPTYTLAAPPAAGVRKTLVLNPSSSGATHRCVVSTSAWSGVVNHNSATGDKITLNTSAQYMCDMISQGTTAWRVIMAYAVKEPAIS